MEEKKTQLPENAHRELKPGEEYQPLLSPQKNYPEVTAWSVCLGILMTILFSAAAAYLGLKVGQVFEAAIPIAIIAVGLSSGLKRKNALGENVMIQSIGSCSGAIVAGAIFTLPALFILQDKYPELTVNFTKVFFSSLLGGILGILFLIPFRKYFVKEQHGKYPFPEATATTQVLVSGESGGKGAKTLLVSGLIGGLYDFIVSTFGLWGETLTTRILPWGAAVADKAKLLLKVNTGAAVLGLGYIVGLKYAFIICCGSFLVWLVIIPVMNLVWGGQVIDLMNTGITQTIGEMSADQIFKEYARHIGIGGIATAGIVGIVDYAHTPDAVENVLKTINDIVAANASKMSVPAQVITVVGCGGNRDKGKRPIMAKSAYELSTQLILTSDNPRDEEPHAILQDMAAGLSTEELRHTLIIEDRESAIKTACALARYGDVILVAGKGHEDYQIIKGVKHHFDDHEVVKGCL